MWKFKRPAYVPTTLHVERSNGNVETLLPQFPVKVEFVQERLAPGEEFHWTTGTLIGEKKHMGIVVARTHDQIRDEYLILLKQVY